MYRERGNRNISIIRTLLKVLTAVLIFGIGYTVSNRVNNNLTQKTIKRMVSNIGQSGMKYSTIFSLIDNHYVEEIDIDSIAEDMIPSLLRKLDPHSTYVSPKDVKLSTANLEGKFDGVGIVFNMITDTIIIQNVMPGGPSDKKGIQGGDRIITIDGENVAGKRINQDSILNKLRGVGGTEVTLGIERRGIDSIMNIPVIRGKITINSINAAYMATPTTGYIKLVRFARSSHEELKKAVDKLYKEGMKHLILDLTENRGGYLDQAILIANEFLPQGSTIVTTNRRGAVVNETRADGKGNYIGQDVFVLINENSASSSEIVAGALQDNDVGTIIGRRSFGKGLVQQQIPMTDGSLLNLTIATYHTPTGRSIQKPYKGNIDEYDLDFYKRAMSGELVNRDSVKIDSTKRYTTPLGKVVYGGGGIMPDVFVPIDTTKYDAIERKMLISLVLVKYTNKYIDSNRKELEKIKNFKELDNYFKRNGDKLYNGYVDYINKQGIKISKKDAIKARTSIERILKGRVGQFTEVGDDAFYRYYQDEDDIIMEAIKIINDKEK